MTQHDLFAVAKTLSMEGSPRSRIYALAGASSAAVVEGARLLYRLGQPAAAAKRIDPMREVALGFDRIADDASATALWPDGVVGLLARNLAGAAHMHANIAFDRGLAAPRAASAKLTARLAREERALVEALGRVRRAAIAGTTSEVRDVLLGRAQAAFGELAAICFEAARASRHAATASELGVRASVLARRNAMLLAASLLLEESLRDAKRATRIQKDAKARTSLSRLAVPAFLGRPTLQTARPGKRMRVLARVRDVEWQEGLAKPRSVARLVRDDEAIVVPHKSMGHQGVTSGAVVWGEGTIKRETDELRLEIAFLPLTTHARRVWEDWLAVFARPAYDLYPGSLRLEWELPELGMGEASADFYARRS